MLFRSPHLFRVLATAVLLLLPRLTTPALAGPTGPPLTPETALSEETVERYSEAMGWLLGVRMSVERKATLQDFLREYAERGDAARLREVRRILDDYAKLGEQSPAEQEKQRWMMLPESLRYLKQQAEGGLGEAAWMLRVYYTEHPVFTHGDPPLTRDAAAAWIAIDRFARTTILRPEDGVGKPLPRARQRALMKARWKELPADRRYKLLRMPGTLAELKRSWEQTTPRKQRELRQAVAWGATEFLIQEKADRRQ